MGEKNRLRRIYLVYLLGCVLAFASSAMVVLLWPLDGSMPATIVSTPLVIFILDLAVLIALKMSQKKKPDGTYILSVQDRRICLLVCWFMAIITVVGLLKLGYEQLL